MSSKSVILEGTTDAAQSSAFDVNTDGANKVVQVALYGLAGAETGRIQRKNVAGTFVTVTTSDFTEFTASLNTAAIIAPGTYRVDKDATAGSAYVEVEY